MELVSVIALSKRTGTGTEMCYNVAVLAFLDVLIGCFSILSACHALLAVLLVTVPRSMLHGSLLHQQLMWCSH